MSVLRLTSGLVACLAAACAQAQLTMNIAVPAGTPAGATVYVAGTFNGWNPGDPAYALERVSATAQRITLPAAVTGVISFKFTLGSWETVELDANGFDVPNRVAIAPTSGTASYDGTVAAWRDNNDWPLPNSTATDSVSILDFAFSIPQLNRTRRIWLYLPPDYDTTTKRYPVLYLQDGQNVFDAATSFAGEWQVDETLDALHADGHWGAIVVAIANGEGSRADEYHPWPNPQFGGGEGDLYLDFLVDTLKPYIDANFRTLANRRNTGVGGSSSAGVISQYAAVREPAVVGRVLAFSPAFFVNPQIYTAASALTPPAPPSRYTFVSGLNETAGGQPPGVFAVAQNDMVQALSDAGIDVASHVRALLPADGTHSEGFWAREFGPAFAWLFDAQRDSDADATPDFADNCANVANADQRDSDGDGFGNACDADLNNDCQVNFVDLGAMKAVFFGTDANADLDGDGAVNFSDLGRMKAAFFTAPGPSGVSEACTGS
ncbi:MAG: alpha/beta hydrolase-fold protein [Pseudomonadota bacterium]